MHNLIVPKAEVISKVHQNGVVLCTSNYVAVNNRVFSFCYRCTSKGITEICMGHNRENFWHSNVQIYNREEKNMPKNNPTIDYRWFCTGLVGGL